jgi:hypothetical protein
MQWTLVVLWLMGEAALPTRTGNLLEAREAFASAAECVSAIPAYQQKVLHDFGARGVVVCVAKGEPTTASLATRG